jgi:hypothetical protein
MKKFRRSKTGCGVGLQGFFGWNGRNAGAELRVSPLRITKTEA